MLTDYHVHLRPDEPGTTVERYFTAENAKRYREAASERGIEELGVSEHIYRFTQALTVWSHPFWVQNSADDLDEYAAYVRQQTDLKLGIEADFVLGAEDRMQELLLARDFDYVVGSVHFVGDRAVDMDEFTIWDGSHSVEEIWTRYFELLAIAARSGLFDILAHADLVKVWGRGRPQPDGDLRRYYEPAIEAIAESGIAVEVSTAGLRKHVEEIYPAPAFLAMCMEVGAPIALSSDAHVPEHIGADYSQALELLEAAGVSELCVFSRRQRSLQPIGVQVA
ncbi:MAG TPA: histidinol-phosphatase [Solirubrobacteraceae bacterium]|jgi:histidinol-phosphatase (PHP family)